MFVAVSEANGEAAPIKGHPSQAYKNWLDQDVRWIISDQGRAAFKQLAPDSERDQFIGAFWEHCDPTPDTYENEYKEEHYRRVDFANEQFGSFLPGWKTDRGRIYIIYGPPDKIESRGSGGTYTSPTSGKTTFNLPSEIWRYRYIEGIGQDVALTFFDICNCGDYRVNDDLSSNTTTTDCAVPETALSVRRVQPQFRFRDLYGIVAHKVNISMLPMAMRTDFFRTTDFTVSVPISIRLHNRDLRFTRAGGIERATLNIFGWAVTPTGRVAESFEDTLEVVVPNEQLPTILSKVTVYQRTALLRPGKYHLAIAVHDLTADRASTEFRDVQIPEYKNSQLATSSLILADKMGPVSPENGPGTGHFLVGSTYVRPLVAPGNKPISLSKGENINVWMQVYGLGIDEKANKSSTRVEYDLIKAPHNRLTFHILESPSQTENSGHQMTVKKTFSASKLQLTSFASKYTTTLRIRPLNVQRSS